VLVSSVPAVPFIVDQVSFAGDVSTVSAIGLAPPGCTVSTASSTDLNTFGPEPTGSYIVRTPATVRPEYWRVSCAGIVREQFPASAPTYVPLDGVQAALAGAVGLQPGDAQKAGVQEAVALGLTELAQRGSELTGAPQVVWAGVPQVDPGPDAVPQPFALVAAAPAARSGWLVSTSVWDIGGDGNRLDSALISTSTDPTTSTVVALLQGGSEMFVLAPPSARGVRLQTVDGSVVRDVELTSRVAVLELPGDPNGLVVQANDQTGDPLGPPTPVRTARPTLDTVDDWSAAPTAG
jgi:hypothetical protein